MPYRAKQRTGKFGDLVLISCGACFLGWFIVWVVEKWQ
jgi:hypothetical protein